MRTHLRGDAREQIDAAVPARRAAVPWASRWLELAVVVAAAATAVVCLTGAWPAPLPLVLLLAVPPALAGIGAATVLRPLAYGAAALVAAAVTDAVLSGGITMTTGPHQLPLAAAGAVVVTTALSLAGHRLAGRAVIPDLVDQDQQHADVASVAEAAQRALLSPLPEQLGPLQLGVVYLAAAAEAKVGGDLYEVTRTENYGIRLIIGDVRGKGLGAVEVAADIIGRFREVAHGVGTLNEVAHRLDAGLSRRWGPYEEFVTALLAEIDPERGTLTMLNCGHPPPLLYSQADGTVTALEVRAPAPPLGLLTLGSDAGAKEIYAFKPNDQLLLYTDGVTEARDASREFYPLDERVKVLAPQIQQKLGRTGRARGAATPTLLDLVRDDLLSYVGGPPNDDAALLLVRAPAAWPGRPPMGAVIR
jgi:serine phosphatase RsbU (regulator of sigma subunit)